MTQRFLCITASARLLVVALVLVAASTTAAAKSEQLSHDKMHQSKKGNTFSKLIPAKDGSGTYTVTYQEYYAHDCPSSQSGYSHSQQTGVCDEDPNLDPIMYKCIDSVTKIRVLTYLHTASCNEPNQLKANMTFQNYKCYSYGVAPNAGSYKYICK